MICAFLLFSGAFKTSKEVLSYYAGKRTFDSNGVTIPRGDTWTTSPLRSAAPRSIRPPGSCSRPSSSSLQFSVIQHFHVPFKCEIHSTSWNDSKVVLKSPRLALSRHETISYNQTRRSILSSVCLAKIESWEIELREGEIWRSLEGIREQLKH